LDTKISSIPDEIIEIQEVLEEIRENKQELQGISNKEKEYMDEIAEKLEFIKKFEAFQDVFNIDEALKNKQLGEDLGSEIEKFWN